MSGDGKRIRVLGRPDASALEGTVEDWLAWLGGPTLLEIEGRDASRTRAVSTLLHGNEPSGIRALHTWLRSGTIPAVNVVCFVGSVQTALEPPGFAHRTLPGHRDLNRCFAPPFEGEEGEIARELLERLRTHHCETLVDLHNTSGHSPPYGVASGTDPKHLGLTALFSKRLVHYDLSLGALTEAADKEFPSVTVECGRSQDPRSDAAARVGLERYLSLDSLAPEPAVLSRVEVFERPVRVCIRPGIELAFGEGPAHGADFTVAGGVDRHNFEQLPPGTPIGWLGRRRTWPLEAVGATGEDLSRAYFATRGGSLATRRPMTPIMMTTAPELALSDCLFYAVEPREPSRRDEPAEGYPSNSSRIDRWST